MTWIDFVFALLFVLAGTGLFVILDAALWYTAIAFGWAVETFQEWRRR